MPGDGLVAGNEASVRRQIAESEAAGVSDFVASPFAPQGAVERTLELLISLARTAERV
jgi:hypothetical protein